MWYQIKKSLPKTLLACAFLALPGLPLHLFAAQDSAGASYAAQSIARGGEARGAEGMGREGGGRNLEQHRNLNNGYGHAHDYNNVNGRNLRALPNAGAAINGGAYSGATNVYVNPNPPANYNQGNIPTQSGGNN